MLLLGALLRFHDLTLQSLWFDELMTWKRSSVGTLSGVIAGAAEDVWPPGYSLFMWGVMRLAGDCEFVLRLPAAFGGVLSTAAIYALGHRVAGKWAGVIASICMATLWVSVYYSQEARPYSGLIVLCALSSYCWLRVMETLQTGSRLAWQWTAGYILTALLMLYWNYYGLVMLGLQGLAAAVWHLRTPRRRPVLAGMYLLIALGYAPWIGELANDLGTPSYAAPRPGPYFEELAAYFRFLLDFNHGWFLAATALVGAALGVEIWRAARRKPHLSLIAWAMLLGWMLIPFSLTWQRSLTGPYSLYLHRYLLISLPALCLLLGAAISRLPLPRRLMPALAALLAVGLGYWLVYQIHYYYNISKAQFREAARFVVQNDPPESDSLLVGHTGYVNTESHFNYYFQQYGWDRRIDVLIQSAADLEKIEQVERATKAPYVWLISAFPLPPEIRAYFEAHYDEVSHTPFYNAEVWLFKRRD